MGPTSSFTTIPISRKTFDTESLSVDMRPVKVRDRAPTRSSPFVRRSISAWSASKTAWPQASPPGLPACAKSSARSAIPNSFMRSKPPPDAPSRRASTESVTLFPGFRALIVSMTLSISIFLSRLSPDRRRRRLDPSIRSPSSKGVAAAFSLIMPISCSAFAASPSRTRIVRVWASRSDARREPWPRTRPIPAAIGARTIPSWPTFPAKFCAAFPTRSKLSRSWTTAARVRDILTVADPPSKSRSTPSPHRFMSDMSALPPGRGLAGQVLPQVARQGQDLGDGQGVETSGPT